MAEIEKLNIDDLDEITGGTGGGGGSWRPATPRVKEGYLALRSKPFYHPSNEITAINNGSVFRVNLERWNDVYIWANYKNLEGWVNSDYITML